MRRSLSPPSPLGWAKCRAVPIVSMYCLGMETEGSPERFQTRTQLVLNSGNYILRVEHDYPSVFSSSPH